MIATEVEDELSIIYLSDNGDDEAGDGTEEFPLKTLKRAFVRAADGATIYIVDTVNIAAESTLGGGKTVTIEKAPLASDATLVRTGATGYLIDIQAGSTLNIDGLTIDGADILSDKSAINVFGGTLYLNNVTLTNNLSSQNGGAIIMGGISPKVEITGGLITNNVAAAPNSSRFGSAVYVSNSGENHADLTLKGDVRIGDNATDNGIYLDKGNIYLDALGTGASINFEDMANAATGAVIAHKRGGNSLNADLGYLHWKSIAYTIGAQASSENYTLILGATDFYVAAAADGGSDEQGTGAVDKPYATFLKAVFSLPKDGGGDPIPTVINLKSASITIDRETDLPPQTSVTLQKWSGLAAPEATAVRAATLVETSEPFIKSFFISRLTTSITLKDIVFDGNNLGSAPILDINGGIGIMESGKIINNKATTYGAGVAITNNGSFSITNAEISGNISNSGMGHEVFIASGSTFILEGRVLIGTPTTGIHIGNTATPPTLTLTGDLDITSRVYLESIGETKTPAQGTLVVTKTGGDPVSVAESRNFIWLTYGKAVIPTEPFSSPGTYEIADYTSIYVANSEGSYHGSDTDGDGSELHPYASIPKAIQAAPNASTTVIVMDDITQAAAATVPASKDITVTTWHLYDGTAPATVSRGFSGAADMFTVSAAGTLRFTNIIVDGKKGTYTANTGSLVRVDGGAFYLNSGAVLKDNRAAQGGGVYINLGNMTINGGVITGNTATTGSGVYYAYTYPYASFTVMGDAQVGKSPADNGVYLVNAALNITQSGDLGSDARINIDGKAGEAANLQIANKPSPNAVDDSAKYFYKNTIYTIIKNTSNAAQYILSVRTDFYVASAGFVNPLPGGQAGSDTVGVGDGTAEKPFLTIARALAIAGTSPSRIHIMNDISSGAAGTVTSGRDITILTWSGYAANPGVDPVRATVTRSVANNVLITVSSGATLRIGGVIFDGARDSYTTNTTSLINVASGGTAYLNTGSLFTNNRAANGGGVSVAGALVIAGATIKDNTATGNGGGIYVSGNGSVTASASTEIRGNTAANGGGVYATATTTNSPLTLSFSNSTISFNHATVNGGGFYVYTNASSQILTATLSLTNSSIISNSTAGQGGGIYNYAKAREYYSYTSRGTSTVTMNGGEISSNTAMDGAGVYVVTETDGAPNGSVTASFTATGGTIQSNIASRNGGGIFTYVTGSSSTVSATLTNTLVTANQAVLGKAIYHSGTNLTLGGAVQVGTADTDNGIYLANKDRVITQSGNLGGTAHIEIEYLADAHGSSLVAARTGSATISNDEHGQYHYQSTLFEVVKSTSAPANYVLKVSPNLYVANHDYVNTLPGGQPGNDQTGDGSAAKPFATISRALYVAATDAATTIHVMSDLTGEKPGTVRPGSNITIKTDFVYFVSAGSADAARATVYRNTTGNLITVAHDGTNNVKGVLRIEDLVIDGKNSTFTNAGGSLIFTNGTLTLGQGSLLTNNTTSGNGGGVYVSTNSYNAATLTMTDDAAILGNSALIGKGVYYAGSSFTVSGNAKVGTAQDENGIYIASASGYITQSGDLDGSAHFEIEAINDAHGNVRVVYKASGDVDDHGKYYYQDQVFTIIVSPADAKNYVLYIAPDLYVARDNFANPYGVSGNDDTGRGTLERPFKTIARAMQVATTDSASSPALSTIHVMSDIPEVGYKSNTGTVRSGAYITLKTWDEYASPPGPGADPVLATATRGIAGNLITVSGGGKLDIKGLILNGNLAGYAANKGSLVFVSGGTLLIDKQGGASSVLTNNQSENGGAVRVNGGSFVLADGILTANKASLNGGAVRVDTGATFTLNGGIISNNIAAANGGGISVADATVVMNTGSISGNKAVQGGGVQVAASSSYGTATSNFTLAGGSITGNTATQDGGGVDLRANSIADIGIDDLGYSSSVTVNFTMTAGQITNNTATRNGGGISLDSHAACFDDWWYENYADYNSANSDVKARVSGGSINGNTAAWGAGVYANRLAEEENEWCHATAIADLVVSGTAVIGIAGSSPADNGVYLANNDNTIKQSGNLEPAAHIEVSGKLGAQNGTEIVTRIDSPIPGNNDSGQYHYQASRVVIVQNTSNLSRYILEADMNLYVADPGFSNPHGDGGSNTTGDGTVEHPYATLSKALSSAIVGESHIFIMSDITESAVSLVKENCPATISTWSGYDGSGADPDRATVKRGNATNGNLISIYQGVSLRIGNLIIDGNKSLATANTGSLVLVNTKASFYLDADGLLTNNKAANGGAVIINNATGTSATTFVMTSAEISNNTVTGSGGGVYLNNTGYSAAAANTRISFTMTDSEITGNSAGSQGGGVYISNSGSVYNGTYSNNFYSNYSQVNTVLENSSISGNTAQTGKAVYLNSPDITKSNQSPWSNYAQISFVVRGKVVIDAPSADDGIYLSRNSLYVSQTANLTEGSSVMIEGMGGALPGDMVVSRSTEDTDGSGLGVYHYKSTRYTIIKDTSNAKRYILKLDNNYYVAATDFDNPYGVAGNDVTGDGTKQTPYATVSKTLSSLYVGTLSSQVASTIHVMTDVPAAAPGTVRTGSDVTIQTWDEFSPNGGTAKITRGVTGNLLTVQNGAKLRVGKVRIDGNKSVSSYNGSLIKAEAGSAIYLNNGSVVTNNKATDGGAVYGVGTEALSVTVIAASGAAITDNIATRNGGGIALEQGTLTNSGASIERNQAVNGGGVYLYNSSMTMSNGSISENTATQNGGGLYQEVESSQIANGYSYDSLSTSKTSTFSGGSISGNGASVDGGGVYLIGHLEVEELYYEGFVADNTFTMTAGNIDDNTAAGRGGAVAIVYEDDVVNDWYWDVFFKISVNFNMQGGELSGNTAKYGAGIYQSQADEGYDDGMEATWDHAAKATITGGSILGNTLTNPASGKGAAIYAGTARYVTVGGNITIGSEDNRRDNGVYIAEANGFLTQQGALGGTANIHIEPKPSQALGSQIAYRTPAGVSDAEAAQYYYQSPAFDVARQGTQYYVLAPVTKFYVSAASGDDATGLGTREYPLATIDQALLYTSPNAPTIIYMMDDYTLGAEGRVQTVNVNGDKKVTIVKDPETEGGVTLARSAVFAGDLFTVAAGSDLTFGDLTIDGNATAHPSGTGTVVQVNGAANGKPAQFYMTEESVIRGNHAAGNGGAINMTGNTGRVYLYGGLITENTSDGLGQAIYYGVGTILYVKGSPRVGVNDFENGVYIATSTAVGGASTYIQQQGDLEPGANINVEDKAGAAPYDFVAYKTGGTENPIGSGKLVSLFESNYYRWQNVTLRLVPGNTNEYILANVHAYYVSNSIGSDTTGVGTSYNPFKTLERAFKESEAGAYTNIYIMDNGVTSHETAVLKRGVNITIQKYENAGLTDVLKAGNDLVGPMIQVQSGTIGEAVATGLTLKDVSFSGASMTHGAPLVVLEEGASVTMLGGALQDTVGVTGQAAALQIGSGALFTFAGGFIQDNTSSDSAVIELAGSGILLMSAGTIIGNTAQADSALIHTADSSSFIMHGGVIRDNLGEGAGVLFTGGQVIVSGDVQILCDNAGHGILLGADDEICLDGDLSENARIDVSGKTDATNGTVIANKMIDNSGTPALAPVNHNEARKFYWEPGENTIIEKPDTNQYVLGDFEVLFEKAVANGIENVETSTNITLTFDVNVPGISIGSISLTDPSTGGSITKYAFKKVAGQEGVYLLTIRGVWAEGATVDVTAVVPGVNMYPPTITGVALHRSAADITPYDLVKETWDTEANDGAGAYSDLLEKVIGDLPVKYKVSFGVPTGAGDIISLELQDVIPVGLLPAYAPSSTDLSDCVKVYIGNDRDDITAQGTLQLKESDTVISYTFDLGAVDLTTYLNEDVVMELTFVVDEANLPTKVKNIAHVIVNDNSTGVPSVDTETPEQDVVYYHIDAEPTVELTVAQAEGLINDIQIIDAADAEAWFDRGLTTRNATGVIISDDDGFAAEIGTYDVVFAIEAFPSRTATTRFVIVANPPVRHTVTYHSSGHTDGDVPDATEHDHGTVIQVKDQGTLVKANHTFDGWSVDQAAQSVDYEADAPLTVDDDVDLYAVWTQIPPPPSRYTVTYKGNGNTGGTVPSDSLSPYISGSTATILGAGNLSRTDYTFVSWNTAANGSGNTYPPGAPYIVNGNATLFAQWTYNGGGDDDPRDPPEQPRPPVNPPEPPNPPVNPPVIVDPPENPTVVPPVTPTPPAETIVTPSEQPEAPTDTSITVTGFSDDDVVKFEAQTGNLFADLANGNVPLGNFFGKGAWSLLSLLFSLIAIAISALLLIGVIAKRRGENENEHENTKKGKTGIFRALTIIAGILTLVIWLVLDDTSLAMAWINNWTLVVGIIFVVDVVLFIIYKIKRQNEDREEEEDYSSDL